MTTPMASAPKQLETKHTPGPWTVQPSGVIYDARSIPIKLASGWREDAWCDDDQTDESIANAKLIAAAPEMAEALQECLNYIANTESELGITLGCGDAARAALAKIGGAS